MIRFHILVSGRVQGVGYRYFTRENAEKYNCTGWVKNLPDGRVEAEIQGQEDNILQFLSVLRKGPAFGYVIDIVRRDIPLEEKEKRFKIRY